MARPLVAAKSDWQKGQKLLQKATDFSLQDIFFQTNFS